MRERGDQEQDQRQSNDAADLVRETDARDSATTRRALLTGGAVVAGAAVATLASTQEAAAANVVLGAVNDETTATTFRSSGSRAVGGIVSAASAIAVTGNSSGAHGSGVYGVATGISADSYGVWGVSNTGPGVRAESRRGDGLTATGGSTGVIAEGYYNGGLFSASASLGAGVQGVGLAYGVIGYANPSGRGVQGRGRYGVVGISEAGGGVGVFGTAHDDGHAVYADGNCRVTGKLSKAAGDFQIDHPLDPEHKWLRHSFVESPDMMNVYNGNVTTDSSGLATVTLPSYFAALNRDFRYQLTVIGKMAHAIVDSEITGNQFRIRTDQGNVKVSWMVTGIRQDDYAKAHPIVVEEAKNASEAGARQFVPKGSTARLMRHDLVAGPEVAAVSMPDIAASSPPQP